MRWVGGFLLLALLAVAGLSAGQDERRTALVIGNGAYRHVAPLPNPRNDAEAMAAELSGLGFEVTTVIDSELAALGSAVNAFGSQSEGADITLVFYAGHGLQIGGENYLLPVDARISGLQDLATAALRLDEIEAALAEARPGLAVVILDACRDNPFVEAVEGNQGLASGSVFGGESEASRSSDVLIAFAAAPGAVAADGEDGNSPFTTALLKWIDRPGLEIGTMFRRVRQTVVELTGGAQVPWVEESLLADVYLNRSDPALLAKARPAPFDEALLTTIRAFDDPTEREAAFTFYDQLGFDGEGELQPIHASLAADEQSAFVQQSMIWLSIRESIDPAIFEAFLERFPDSGFADLARLRLAALRDFSPTAVEVAEHAAPALKETPTLVLEPAEADRAEPTSPGEPVLGEPGSTGAARPTALTSPAEAEAALALDRPHLIAAQRLLAEAGHYRGGLDGAIGPMSRAAIEAFQRAEGLPVHGHLDQQTLRRLVDRGAGPALADETARETRLGIHGLASIAAGAEPKTIRVAGIERHPDILAHWRRIADAFEARHPGFPVEFHYQPGPYYKRNLLLMLGSSTPPDVFFTWGGGHLAAMSDAGFARDLTSELADGWAMSFKPGALQNLTVGDHVYAIPSQMALVSLYANRRHLEAVGVSPGELETWSGFMNAVRRLKEAGFAPIGAGGADRWPLQLYWGSLAQALAGHETIEKALRGEGQGFADDAFVRASEMIVDLASLEPFQPGYLDETANDAVDAVAAGAATMVLTGDWSIPRLQRTWSGGKSAALKEMVRIPFPPKDLAQGGRLTYGGTDGWVVAANAPDEAVELVKELASVESQSTLAERGLAVPAVPGADSLIGDPFLLGVADELTLSTFHQLYLDQVLGPEAGEVLNDVAVALVDGDLTPTRAAASIEAAWKRVRGPEPATLQPETAE